MKHSALRRAAGRKTSEQARKNPGRYWTIRAIPSASRRALPVQMTAVSAWAKTKNSTAPRPVPAGMGAVLFRAGEKGARGRQRAAVEAAQDVRKVGGSRLPGGLHSGAAGAKTEFTPPVPRAQQGSKRRFRVPVQDHPAWDRRIRSGRERLPRRRH